MDRQIERKRKLIEIHMIQNHAPANLNRDDLGAPKTCVFGGVTRARISSQCIKRSIRRSLEFQQALERDGGVRTRRLITLLAQKVHGTETPPKELVEFVAGVFEKGGIKRTGKGEEPDNTNILLFLPTSAIDELVKTLEAKSDRGEAAQTELAEQFAGILGRAACVPDIALSGRMIELDQKGLFAKLDLGVDAAISAAHAISTHEASNEVDYFTAADDLGKGPAAGHVDEAQFASACFYKYFCLDWEQLLYNLTPSEQRKNGTDGRWDPDTAPEDVKKLAAATLGHFLIAAATTNPSGKQNSFAAHNPPDGILVEVKDTKTPTNYANAFAEPACRIGKPDDDAADGVSLVGRSIAQLGDYIHAVRNANGTESTLLWHSPTLWRYPLRGWKRNGDGKKQEAVPLTEKCYPSLKEEEGKSGLVEAVLSELGFTWSEVKNAAKEAKP